MARTDLFRLVRKAAQRARALNRQEQPSKVWTQPISRREALRRMALGGTALALGPTALSGCRGAAAPPRFSADPEVTLSRYPKIAIVGAGLAGLACAHELRKNGVTPDIFEASPRVGGRVFTAQGLMQRGVATELGGEFIDTGHEEMFRLADELGLKMVDMLSDPMTHLIADSFHFGGQVRSEEEILAAFRPFIARLDADMAEVGESVNFREAGGATALDRLTLAEYLAGLDVEPWLRTLLEVCYVTFYGLDAGEQSAFNLLWTLWGTEADAESLEIFGESDERYKIAGGNERITQALAARHGDLIQPELRLIEARKRPDGTYTLTFENPQGGLRQAAADAVVFALPFTMLRQADLSRLELPPWKSKAINELGYGTNAKVILGFNGQPWREHGHGGTFFTEQPIQSGWDSARLQIPPEQGGVMTVYLGGTPGVAVGQANLETYAQDAVQQIDSFYPGTAAAFSGKVERFHWPTHPFTRGSYACYRPGQWTTISGAEGEPVEHLFFAGEHCSPEFQGYMNGAAVTGRQAAEAILTRTGRALVPV